MRDSADFPTDDDARLNNLLARYLESIDAGTPLDQQAFLEQHPGHRGALERYFENVAILEELTGGDLPADDAAPDREAREETVAPDEAGATRPLGDDASTAAAGELPPEQDFPRCFGRYRILGALGQGAMGAVFVAYDTQLDRKVALKIPHCKAFDSGETRKRFYREARAAAKLRHANICPVYDFGEIEGQQYIAMALIEGFPLKEFARSSARPSERHAALLIRKLALGLAEAHRQGIVHRDLKSTNVIVDHAGEPIVTDFGLAQNLTGDDAGLTRSGDVVGTPAYMSPEQITADSSQIGPAADIYGLGVVLYELLTGQPPFQGPLHSILKQIGCDEPKPPSTLRPELDSRLEAICLKMLAKRPGDRYKSMEAVAAALADFLALPARRNGVKPPRGIGWFLFALSGFAALTAISVFYFQTATGTLIIEVNDPGIEVRVVGEEIRVTHGNKDKQFVLKPSDHQLEVRHGDLTFTTPEFTVKRNTKTVLHVEFVGDEIAVRNQGSILARSALPERAVVKAVLSIGGTVHVESETGESKRIESVEDIPARNIRLAVTIPEESPLDKATLDALAASDQIVRLAIHSPARGEDLLRLGALPHLEQLHFYHLVNFETDDLKPLAGLKKLTVLRLRGPNNPSLRSENYTDELLGIVSQLKQLEQLDIGAINAPIGDRGLAHLQNLPRLKDLGLEASNITDEGLKQVLVGNPQLRYLRVTTSNSKVEGEFLAVAAELSHLEVLHLYCEHLQDNHLPKALQIASLKELCIIDAKNVSGQAISDAKVLPLLDNLVFHETGLEDEGLRQIGRFSSLRKLSIRGNLRITDDGLEHLAGLSQLLRLDISDNPQISDALVDLCQELPVLSQVSVSRTGITAEGLKELERTKVGVVIHYTQDD